MMTKVVVKILCRSPKSISFVKIGVPAGVYSDLKHSVGLLVVMDAITTELKSL